jgi:hypothetical protein
MTHADIEILLKYLVKVVVPPADHDEFIRAVERLEALLYKGKKVA